MSVTKEKINMRKTNKTIAALVIAVAIWPKSVKVYPADWALPDEEDPDICLGTSNDYWVRSNDGISDQIYLQMRDAAAFLRYRPESAHCIQEAAKGLCEIGISVALPWLPEEIDAAYRAWPQIAELAERLRRVG